MGSLKIYPSKLSGDVKIPPSKVWHIGQLFVHL